MTKLRSKKYYEKWADSYIRRRKRNRFLNRIWKKVWWFPITVFSLLIFIGATIQMYKDYKLVTFHANLDAPFADIYTKWNTDGSPGQDPPR